MPNPKHKAHLALQNLSGGQMRTIISLVYDALYDPPNKDWSADTFDDIVRIFVSYDLVPEETTKF
jgi:hypothetical protein